MAMPRTLYQQNMARQWAELDQHKAREMNAAQIASQASTTDYNRQRTAGLDESARRDKEDAALYRKGRDQVGDQANEQMFGFHEKQEAADVAQDQGILGVRQGQLGENIRHNMALEELYRSGKRGSAPRKPQQLTDMTRLADDLFKFDTDERKNERYTLEGAEHAERRKKFVRSVAQQVSIGNMLPDTGRKTILKNFPEMAGEETGVVKPTSAATSWIEGE